MTEPIALPALIAARAAESPDAVYLIDAVGDRAYTYGEVHRRARQWSAALAELGVSAGDVVATMLLNEAESVAVWLGVAYLGAVEVPGNVDYRGSLLRHYLTTSRAKVAVVHTSCADQLVPAGSALPSRTVLVGPGGPAPADGMVAASTLTALAQSPPDGPVEPSLLSGIASVMFTSGTTGPSKGVVIPWMQLHESAMGWMPIGGTAADGGTHNDEYRSLDPCYYSPYPFHHMASRAPLHLMALLGGRVVLRPAFKTDLFWPEVRRYGCTSTELLGTMALFLNNAPPSPHDRDNPLRSVLVVPLIREVEQFCERFDVRVWTVYNMTELSIPLVSDGFDLVDNTSCGRVRPGYSVRLVDAVDEPVPIGEVGELVVRSERPWALMAGYWDLPDATAAAWRNLWLHTGDAFRQDEDGNFYFVDRMKDTIRRRGENISSLELEVEVRGIDGILGVAAVGVPSDVGEEEVKIVAVRRPGAVITEAELTEQLADRVPRFMVPRYVEWVDELPMTPTQKIRKSVLRQNWRTTGTWDAATKSFLECE